MTGMIGIRWTVRGIRRSCECYSRGPRGPDSKTRTFEANRIIRVIWPIRHRAAGAGNIEPTCRVLGVLYFVCASIASRSDTPGSLALEVASPRKLVENYSPPLSTQDNPLAFAFKAWPMARGAGIPEDVGFRRS